MPRQIAFLRAINITGRYVKMADLRRSLTNCGFEGVQTYIQTGNVIVEMPETPVRELEQRMEQCLESVLGYPVATFIRTVPNLEALIERAAAIPDEQREDVTLYVAFLHEAPSEALQKKLNGVGGDANDFYFFANNVLWLARAPLSGNPVSCATIEKALETPATVRNISTVRKLLAKYG